MYEIEYKVEITADERQALIDEFKKRGFLADRITSQHDFYVEAKDSPAYSGRGYDLKRYRDEGDHIIYTEKTWEMIGDQPARKEMEREVPRETFDAEIPKFPDAKIIKKQREWFKGSHKDRPISITIDSVKFNHSPAMRYFIEAEVVSSDKNVVKELKAEMADFLKDVLNKDDVIESPGMFTMVMKQL